MRELIAQIEKANESHLYYMALFSALTLPDICGALESVNGWATPQKYAAWFDKWVAPKYAFHGSTSITGEICYSYRCAVLHQGRSSRQNMPYSRVIFLEPGNNRMVMHNNVLNDVLNIDVQVFCKDIVASCKQWLLDTENQTSYQKNWAASMQRYPNGLHPYIVGVPVIA